MPLLRVGRWARRTVVVVILLVLVPVLVVGVSLRLFVWPRTDHVEPADAVVVLAGGDGERLNRGLELMGQGVAPTLVLSFGPNRLCNFVQPFPVVCFAPSPENTRGEAEAIGRLAAERGWTNLVLVTSTPHITRARLLVERCYPGRLQVASATPSSSVPGWAFAIAHEWAGLAEATVERDC
ncbi:MAG TPA: YdcF family protein [Acidimicrobiia bacterium]|nr:YdcF family protein [Acidimicrobiia bacterium]